MRSILVCSYLNWANVEGDTDDVKAKDIQSGNKSIPGGEGQGITKQAEGIESESEQNSPDKTTRTVSGGGKSQAPNLNAGVRGKAVEKEVEKGEAEEVEIIGAKSGSRSRRGRFAVPRQVSVTTESPNASRKKAKAKAKAKGESQPSVTIVGPPLYPMLCVEGSDKIEGYGVMSIDQHTFHGKTIPSGYSVMQVQSIVNGGAELPYPNTNDDPPQMVLEDALKSTVLWPTKSIGLATFI
jgi:hypothetical protein